MAVINYIDRQTINVLAPILKKENRWTNSDFALLLISFRVAYTIMQGVNGRLLDRFGTRLGLSVRALAAAGKKASHDDDQAFRFHVLSCASVALRFCCDITNA